MKALQRLILATLLCMAGLHTQAAPFFASKDGSMVWDKATGLVWMRCALGQKWNGSTCIGTYSKYDFTEAQQAASRVNTNQDVAGAKDWKLPSVQELASLIVCSNGAFKRSTATKGDHIQIPNMCPDGAEIPTIDPRAFPRKPGLHENFEFWFSNQAEGTGYVSFSDGRIVSLASTIGFNLSVRLVRARKLLDSEAALAYRFALPVTDATAWTEQKQQRMAAEAAVQANVDTVRHAEAAERAERDAVEAAERTKRERQRAAAERSLLAGGAQALYLQAGRAQRNGSIVQGGESFYATELYEMIVEKFPKSEFAIKASDQLNAMGRSEKEARASREAARAASEAVDAQRQADSNASSRAACFSRVRRCEANCSTWSVPSVCIRDCQESCN